MTIEAIEVWRVQAMLNYIRTHYQSMNKLDPWGEDLETTCNNYLKFIEERKFEVEDVG